MRALAKDFDHWFVVGRLEGKIYPEGKGWMVWGVNDDPNFPEPRYQGAQWWFTFSEKRAGKIFSHADVV